MRQTAAPVKVVIRAGAAMSMLRMRRWPAILPTLVSVGATVPVRTGAALVSACPVTVMVTVTAWAATLGLAGATVTV